MIFYLLKNFRFISLKTSCEVIKNEVLLPTYLLTLKSYWPFYDEEKKYSTTQPHLSPLGLSTFLRWNVKPRDTERRSSLGSSVVFG